MQPAESTKIDPRKLLAEFDLLRQQLHALSELMQLTSFQCERIQKQLNERK